MNVHTSQVAVLVGLLAYFSVRTIFQGLVGGAGEKEHSLFGLVRSH
jgi:hypothetical protein